MAGLSGLKQLRKLDLGANRIRVMEPSELAGLTELQELWLGKNKIECIQGLESLAKLRRLDVQSNRLTRVQGLVTQAPILEELYLAHNGIDDDGLKDDTGLALATFAQLSVLDLSRNQIATCASLAHIESLDELWLSGNQIQSWDAVRPLADSMTQLDTIYLEYNPLQTSDPLYRKTLHQMLPSLTQIDATPIAMQSTNATTGMGGGGGGTAATARQPNESQEEYVARLQQEVVQRAQGKGQS